MHSPSKHHARTMQSLYNTMPTPCIHHQNTMPAPSVHDHTKNRAKHGENHRENTIFTMWASCGATSKLSPKWCTKNPLQINNLRHGVKNLGPCCIKCSHDAPTIPHHTRTIFHYTNTIKSQYFRLFTYWLYCFGQIHILVTLIHEYSHTGYMYTTYTYWLYHGL